MAQRPLVYGTQEEIVQPVATINVEIIEGPRVQLVASFEPDPNERRAIGIPMATTVAIHMDQEAASDLFAQLRETFEKMGWPLP